MNLDTIITDEKDDLLGRRKFADHITECIRFSLPDEHSTFVLGIEGQWGTGKSTLLSFIKKRLRAITEGIFIVVDFNPWSFENLEGIDEKFIDNLKFNLKIKSKKWNNLLQKGEEYSKYIPDERIRKPIEALVALLKEKKKEPQEIREDIGEFLVENKAKLVVIVDDLDRLYPAQIAKVLQLIKTNASFKNTVFLVAYDRDIVNDAMVDQFNQVGKKYLEKIVQVSYRIPQIQSETLKKVFFKKVSPILKKLYSDYDQEFLQGIWLYHGLNGLFHTLRDINRYMNAVALRLHAIHQDINPYHFIVLEAIRTFEPKAYELLLKHRRLLIKNFYRKPTYKRTEEQNPNSTSERIYLEKNGISNEIVLDLIDYIFRQELHHLYSDNNNKEISNHAYFERYFSLEIGIADVSQEEVDRFLNSGSKSNAEAIIDKIARDGRLDNLLTNLCNNALKRRRIEGAIFEVLIDYWFEKEELYLMYYEKVERSIFNLVRVSINPEENLDYVIKHLTNSGNRNFHFAIYNLLSGLILQFDKGFLDFTTDYSTVLRNREEEIREARNRILDQWAETILNSTTLFLPLPVYLQILDGYAKVFPEKYLEYLNHKSTNDGFLPFIFSYRFLTKMTGSNPEDIRWAQEFDQNAKFLLPENHHIKWLVNILKNASPKKFSKEQMLYINELLKLLQSKYEFI